MSQEGWGSVDQRPAVDPDAPRKKLAWEAALGFVGFFTVMAMVTAVWNVFRAEPAVLPSVVLLVLVVALVVVWKGYSRYR
ncbi:hypothetical protein [Corynebacterium auriscanis]|uniref:Uncharacterized protein n=1 Tax=Corynebacterium auriscanis TaxID=99807 RepID=A0A0A2DH39_9CORY|nr:hypothetical protein [Corynebacterium auriscanis]KGM18480.1 hypothetical protein MA47_07060 [Corynebacterium auriscanis]WJY73407.1 hypothetical protein CAURIC_09020 [Corynebacterium auriscanis]